MSKTSSMSKTRLQIDWLNTSILILCHLLAIAAILYLAMVECSPWTLGLAVAWFVLSGLSVTGGYHRLFSHRSYQAHPVLRAFYLLFGAAAVQNSVLRWCADHRRHHAQTDRDDDPYSVTRGFFWAHIAWVMFRPTHPYDADKVQDLSADRLVAFQDRYYVAIAFLMGAVVPASLGLIWGDPIGALLVAGFLRLVVQWHATFSVNSLAHMIGTQPFSTRNSARDSFVTAIVTLGEGYHNFHHAFQHDYRNGICWHHYDPTKWTLWSLDKIGLAKNLRRVPSAIIQSRRQKVELERQEQVIVDSTVTLSSSRSTTSASDVGGNDGDGTDVAPSKEADAELVRFP